MNTTSATETSEPTNTDSFDITGPLPEGTTLIEASAGTGKTWTVAALVTRYVAERGIPLSEMLIVTFSRAASQELRERVRDMLDETLQRLEAPADAEGFADNALVTKLRTGDSADIELRRARLRAALADFDTATIATIHQFCQYVLRSLGVAGDSDSFARLSEDLGQLREDVISDVYLARSNDEFRMPFADARSDAKAALEFGTAGLAPEPPPAALSQRLEFLAAVRAEYRKRKKRAAVIEYDDLLSELATALHGEDSAARTRMRQRWSVVLVDEFQDTDPVQWDVFETAFGEGGEALVLIGDPKQAIYGFRGGDVQTYLRAARTAGRRLSLPTNYRSDGPLVDALGVLLGDVQLSEGIVARPISAARPTARLSGAGESAVELRYLGGEPMAVGDARALAARDAAAEISHLLAGDAEFDGRPVTPADIAVLAGRRADLITMREQLRSLGIPAVLVSSESVLRTEASSWWLQLLMAMEQPHRPERVRAAALTPFLGWTAADLDAAGHAATEEVAARVRGLVAGFVRGGMAAVLDAVRADGLTARLLSRTGGERDLTDIEHSAQLLGEHASEASTGLPALVSWLRERSADDVHATADTRVLRLESDALAVTLTTVHGSKGLQYPIVLTPFLWHHWFAEDRVPKVIHDERGRVISYDIQEIKRPQHRAEALDEDLRLAYVAMTRAQSRLIMWWLPTKRNTLTGGLHRLLFGQAATPSDLSTLLENRAARRNPSSPTLETRITVPREPKGYQPEESLTDTLATWQQYGAFRATLVEPNREAKPPSIPRSTEPLTGRRSNPRSVIDLAWRRTSYSALAAAGEEAGSTSEPETTETGRADEVDIVLPTSIDESRSADASQDTFMETEGDTDVAATPSPMAALPMGATFGSLVHAVLEEADFQAVDLRQELLTQIDAMSVRWPVELDRRILADALLAVCTTPLGHLAADVELRHIGSRDRLPEMDFELPLAGGETPHPHSTLRAMSALLRQHLPLEDPLRPYADELDSPGLGDQALRGYLTGSIDLTFRHDGRFYVVDYKTNWLGDPDEVLTVANYAPERLTAAMNHSSYPLQALLYAVVLHRYLRWRLPDYDPERHLGGVLYLYVRGMAGVSTPRVGGVPYGVFAWRPPAVLVDAVSDVLDGAASTSEPITDEETR